MIRLRIERCSDSEVKVEGIVWYEDGHAAGRVIIEQESPPKVSPLGYQSEEWIPVEVIDEQV